MAGGHPFQPAADRGSPSTASRAAARREVRHFLRQLAVLSLLVLVLLMGAGLALAAFEGRSSWLGILWAIDIVATIGSVGQPVTFGGQITKLILVAFGLGTLFYLLVTVAELFVAGHVTGLLEVRRMQRKVDSLRDHYLICGFGRVGQQVARDLRVAGVPFVVVDDNSEVREAIEEMGVLWVDGRGSEDEVLTEAGIERAQGIIACVDSDAENIFVTLTARELRPDIEIVARASLEASERKLLRAGANDVVSPYKASGDTMARLALGGTRDGQVAASFVPGPEASGAARSER
jgi:voltage-gated potassium channel